MFNLSTLTIRPLSGITALNKKSSRFPWLIKMKTQMNALFNDATYIETIPLTTYLQTNASRQMRNTISSQIAEKLIDLAICGESQVVAREWFLQLLEQYASLKILFTHATPKKSAEIPGLFDYFEMVYPISFHVFMDDEKTDNEIMNAMYAKMIRLEFDLMVAKYCVEVLSDKTLSLISTQAVIHSALMAKRASMGKVVALYTDENNQLASIYSHHKTLFLDSRNKC